MLLKIVIRIVTKNRMNWLELLVNMFNDTRTCMTTNLPIKLKPSSHQKSTCHNSPKFKITSYTLYTIMIIILKVGVVSDVWVGVVSDVWVGVVSDVWVGVVSDVWVCPSYQC